MLISTIGLILKIFQNVKFKWKMLLFSFEKLNKFKSKIYRSYNVKYWSRIKKLVNGGLAEDEKQET